jgi:ankyrin repeat protein
MPIILPPPEPAALFHGFRNHEAKTFLENTKRPVSETKDLLQNQKSLNENTSLIWAIRHGADFSVIKQMLDIGGKDLVLKQNNFGDNAVHQAVWSGSDFDIFKLLVDVGGTDVLSQRDIFGNTPFHVACYWGASKKTIEYLVEVGGKTLLEIENDMEQRPYAGVDNKEVQAYLDSTGGHVYTEHVQEFFRSKCKDLTFMQLLWANNLNEAERRLDDPGQRGELKEKGEGPGWNCLSFSIWLHVHAHSSFQPKLSSLIKRMVQYGGEELISSLNDAGCNALHYAAYHKAPFWIIKCLVEAGGNDIIHVMNEWGNTPLHDACAKGASAEIIEYLAKHGGVEAISKKANNKDKKSPLDILLDDKPASNPLILALQKAWYVHDQRTTTMDKDIITKTLKWAETVDPSLIASNNFVKNLLNQSFCCRQYQVIILLDLYVQIAIVSAVSLGLEKIYHDSATVIVATPTILIVCVTWLIVREVLELFSSRLETYGRSYENYIDISQIVLFVWCIGIFRQVDEENHYDLVGSGSFRGIMISATAVSWLGLSVVIGHLNYNMSVFISAFVMVSLCIYKNSSINLHLPLNCT